MPGGKSWYQIAPRQTGQERVRFEPVNTTLPPGQKVACPSVVPGNLSQCAYVRGTSNATALATRSAALIYENLLRLSRTPNPDMELLDEDYFTVLTKALFVHSSSWEGQVQEVMRTLLNIDPRREKEELSRFLGYGSSQPDRVMICSDHRVTLLGWGDIEKDTRHLFNFPMPEEISSIQGQRTLIATLAWLSPINPRSQRYRGAQLWFDPKAEENAIETLDLSATGVHGNLIKNGTIQHQIFRGQRAVAIEHDRLSFHVNCREDGDKVIQPIRYGFAVTLEVDAEIYDPIYTPVRNGVVALRQEILEQVRVGERG